VWYFFRKKTYFKKIKMALCSERARGLLKSSFSSPRCWYKITPPEEILQGTITPREMLWTGSKKYKRFDV
jgi:hypothetical protein